MENSLDEHDDERLIVPRWTIQESKLLIASVKEQPELYDPSNIKYKLMSITDNLWTNFDLLLKKPLGACKDRWGTLRQTFRKEHTDNKNNSRWKLYKEMLWLKPFLYKRGPSLDECIRKALGGQLTKEKGNNNDDDEDTRMITVMSTMPDGVRYPEEDNGESIQTRNISFEHEQTFSVEYHQSPDPEVEQKSKKHNSDPDFTFAIPKLEPVTINEQIQHMSTPIVKQERVSRGIKRSNHPIIQIGNVKIQRTTTTPGQSTHYTLERETDVKPVKTINCTQIKRFDISTQGLNDNEDTSTSLNHSLSKSLRIAACSCKADQDTMFFQSLVPDIKKLRNSEERMNFKLRVHQLLQEMLYKK